LVRPSRRTPVVVARAMSVVVMVISLPDVLTHR
jgi:hypothetical protein